VPLYLLPVVGFLVALVAAPAGVSGAFLLVPFQLSVLGTAGTAVTPTNLLYNLIATPGGALGYWRQERLDRRLVQLIVTGSLPGVVIGSVLRVTVFAPAAVFKAFVGVVLLLLAIKLLADVLLRRRVTPRAERPWSIILVSFVVGTIGGIYGIGGGSIVAPYLVAIAGFSVYRAAGAALVATFITSAVGLVSFQVLAWLGYGAGPSWAVGILLGVGGFAGSFVGASMQRRLPEAGIKAVVGAFAAVLGVNYLLAARR